MMKPVEASVEKLD